MPAVAVEHVLRQAFRFMEKSAPGSFDDDTEPANDALEMYDTALAMVLAALDWSFARRVQSLAAYTPPAPDIADPDLPHTVQLPDDCLVLRKVYVSSCVTWRQDQRMIRLSSAPPVTVRYTFRAEREKDLPAAFRMAIAAQLAVLLSPRYITTNAKREQLQRVLAGTMDTAATNDRHSASVGRIDTAALSGDWASEATQ